MTGIPERLTELLQGQRCGHTIIDCDGIEQPCDRPAAGWRWYQDVEHEDALDVACDWHVNEGGRRMAELIAEVQRLRDETAAVEELCDWAEQVSADMADKPWCPDETPAQTLARFGNRAQGVLVRVQDVRRALGVGE